MILRKLTLAAMLLAGSAAAALAQSNGGWARPAPQTERTFQSRDVSLPRTAAPSAAEEDWMERASRSYDGGGY